MDLALHIIPPLKQHTHTVVFLHGRGDSARPFADSLSYSVDSKNQTLFEAFPAFRWVFPQSKIRDCAAQPGDKWSQWFDVWDTRNFSEREELQTEGLKESVTSIRRIIMAEIAALGGRSDRLILAGISQGAATATHTLLNLDLSSQPGSDGAQQTNPPRLAAFLGFSCRMPFASRTLAGTRRILGLEEAPTADDDSVIRHTPVLLEHCSDDVTVPVGHGRTLRETLRGFGADVTWREYPDGGHWFRSPTGIDDAIAFINERVLEGAMPDNSYGEAPHAAIPQGDAMDIDMS